MGRQHDFDEHLTRERERAFSGHQGRSDVAEQEEGESWTLHIALLGALVVAMMFSTFF